MNIWSKWEVTRVYTINWHEIGTIWHDTLRMEIGHFEAIWSDNKPILGFTMSRHGTIVKRY
jgi:hypothetical protein